MTHPTTKTQQTFAAIGAIVAWAAVLLQLYLIIVNRTVSIPETLVRFFSYFTVLTNILVALSCSFLLQKNANGKMAIFFSNPVTATAIAVYITIVGLVYNIVLRSLWSPQGLQFVVNELLHSVVPIYFVLYWFISVPKTLLKWEHLFAWLIYPFCYMVAILLLGSSSKFYPYPFMDVSIHGYNKVLTNSAAITMAFVLVSLLFIGIAKLFALRNK